MMKEDNNPKKPLIYYYLIVMATVLFLNAFIFPMIFQGKITEVDYRTFVEKIESGSVRKVEVQDNQIGFIVNEDGKNKVYVTGRMEDPELTKRLLEADVESLAK